MNIEFPDMTPEMLEGFGSRIGVQLLTLPMFIEQVRALEGRTHVSAREFAKMWEGVFWFGYITGQREVEK